MDTTFVRIAHPDIDGSGLIPRSALTMHEAAGWFVVDDDPGSASVDESPGAPARSASKAVWVDYAAGQGMDRDQASDLTRDQLAAIYQPEES